MLGRSFSHYRITGTLGEGGMGVVYRAVDTLLDREVAVKFPAPSGGGSGDRESLLREARAASALTHPNIAAVYDCGECDGSPYVVMELVRGDSLAAGIAAGPMETARAAAVALAVGEALAEAHRNGVVHRDIKPSNIAIGERGQVKVLDFGIARRLTPLARGAAAGAAPTATLETGLSGTPAYMSPEQVRGLPSDPRSDLFSLGAVLYECLAGRRPFEGATPIETMAKVLEQDPPAPSTLRPGISPGLDRVVMKALAKDPARRYGSAEEMLEDLRQAAGAAPARSRLRPRLLLPLAILCVSVLAAALWMARPEASYQPKPEARRFFKEGLSALADGTYYKAARALEQAVRIDPGFTLARAHLADAWNELDYSSKAQAAMLTAMPPGETPARVSERDLVHIQAIHHTLTRDYSAAIALYRRLIAKAQGQEERAILELDLGRAYEHANQLKAALGVYLGVAGREPQAPAARLRAGVVYRRLRQMPQAEAALAKAEALYRSFSNLEGVSEALYQRSIVSHQSGRLADSRRLLDEAARIAQASGNDHQQVTVWLQLTGLCARQGLLEEGRRHAQEALETAQRRGFEDLMARSFLELGANAQYAGDMQEAKRRFADALLVAQRIGAAMTEARARFSLASVKVDLGETAAALADLAPALSFYKAGGYATESSRCAVVQCRALRNQGRYGEARLIAEAELARSRRDPDPVLEQLALDLLGSIAEAQERYSGALGFFESARQAARARNDQVAEYWALASAAGVRWRLGRYREAEKSLSEAAAFAARTRTQALGAAARMIRAEIALSAGRHSDAVQAARDAVRAAPDNMELAAEAKRIAALASARSGGGARAVPLAESALDAARAAGNGAAVLAAQLAKAEALAASGQKAPAADLARQAAREALARGQYESAWRAGILASEGAQATDSELRSSLSAADFNAYMSRPDIRRLLKMSQASFATKR